MQSATPTMPNTASVPRCFALYPTMAAAFAVGWAVLLAAETLEELDVAVAWAAVPVAGPVVEVMSLMLRVTPWASQRFRAISSLSGRQIC